MKARLLMDKYSRGVDTAIHPPERAEDGSGIAVEYTIA